MSRETITAPGAPVAAGPYSHAVRAQGLVFSAGQLGLDPQTNELVGPGAAEQARQALTNLAAVAEAAGATLADTVKVTVFLTDIADGKAVNEVYAEFFAQDPPARSMVAVKALPLGGIVEIEAVFAT